MNRLPYIVIVLLFVIVFGTSYALVNVPQGIVDTPLVEASEEPAEEHAKVHFPVRDGKMDTYEDLHKQYPMDLADPVNYRTDVEYDAASGLYIFRTKVGDMDVVTPFSMTEKEYSEYSMKQSMQKYWQSRVQTELANEKDKKISLTDIQLDIGGADKIFGPGGVQIKMQGSTELLFGFKINRIQNPTLSERMRKPAPIFDFDEKIQLNVNAKVGDKVSFGMNYNTESSFDFDQSKIKLAFEGKEDDIIKNIEAGNVSLPLNSSLIRGSTALFGIKTEMQFGKLRVSAIATQQESESKTVSLRNGAQTNRFDIDADQYDENRHFFLAHYFRNNFEKSMSRLPYINSGIVVNRVEVWVTNNRADFTQSRNVVAFMDLGETDNRDNSHWTIQAPAGVNYPYNKANSLYDEVRAIANIRDIQQVNAIMDANYGLFDIDGGNDYEKVESARRLDPSEYSLNSNLGFISLRSQLNTDEVLAVSFEYTMGGKVYQVGEFSTDGIDPPDALFLKLIKATSYSNSNKNWDLMMKNIYSLGASQVQREKFKLDVMYLSDSTGAYVNYLPDGGAVKNQPLLKVLSLDRLDQASQLRPDGLFDFIEGYTIDVSMGRIIFPVLEPFGSSLKAKIADDALASKVIFTELYNLTKTEALEYSEKNKFKLKGEYKSTVGSEIRLNAMNVPKGSVTVTAGGALLTENIDYTVDYSMGSVTILNQSILESGTNIDVSLESQSFFSMQRKSLSGAHLEYEFNKDFSLGATMMHLTEKPLTTKVSIGDEPMSNTIWGLNASYKKESQLLTNLLDKLPLLKATAPSSISFNGEFAQLLPGHSNDVGKQGLSYIDDFEASKTGINIQYPYSWYLSSTPRDKFPEASLTNTIDYGKNRALLSWYNIDPIFTKRTTTTPDHIRNDVDQLSNHFVREVLEQEIFPNRDPIQGQANSLSVLNLSYYPTERGPYNLDADNINPDGSLKNPQNRWGGIMRKMEVSDFEAANIEYIEFWLMDPFVYNKSSNGGELYFNLGEISEDILKDGKKSFENGLPINGDSTQTVRTVWGRVPKTQSMVNAFDNNESSRKFQDVGMDGLRTEDEFEFDTYKNFLQQYQSSIDPVHLPALQADPFSALNDPAGDNYHYFRGSNLDENRVGILARYKRYNGMDGNSPVSSSTTESYTTSATTLPNVEDINQDNNLSEYEQYFFYKVSLKPSDMVVGQNFIMDKVDATVKLDNGKNEKVSWYQFKIPVRDWSGESGTSRLDFKSIRFMRIFLTGFDEETHLRFATMELVRGDWRTYKKALYRVNAPIPVGGTMDVSVINIEENSDRKPVNYVIPPGITREKDPSQAQIREENEQALSLRVTDLSPGDARAVYKNTRYDMRQFKRLQMFVHAEKMIGDITNLKNSELTCFMRVGSDLSENYYEYEIPLKLTPHGIYGQTEESGDRQIVWPDDNMFDFPLSLLTDVKLSRNIERKKGTGVSLILPYSEYDPDKPTNKITIIGNPNLGDVQNIMIGVRNQSTDLKTGEIWINELRMSDFNEESGYAAVGNASINLSDFGSVNFAGRVETSGFGSVEDNIMDRRMDNLSEFNVSTSFELGRLFPEKAKIRLPLYYSYSKELTKPKYDAFNQDVLLEETLENAETKAERDSIEDYSTAVYTTKGFNLTNVKVDIRSKTPQFYDPANITLGYAYTESNYHNSETERDLVKDYKGSLTYSYSITPKAVEPFKKSTLFKSPYLKLISDFNFYYLPSSISYNTTLMRQYNEIQLRNLSNLDILYTDPTNPLLSSSKNFLWNRKFDLKYDLSKALRFSYSNATNAYIDETKYTPINKELFPTEYENWKDTVMQSIFAFGRPLSYQQVVTASYAVPLNKIPLLNWVSSNVLYNGNYSWDRGPLTVEDEAAGSAASSMGNRINSLGAWQFDGRFSMDQLYNKSTYLKKVNQRFSSRNISNRNKKQQAPPRKNEQKISLTKDKKMKVLHRLNAETVKVTAYDSLNIEYKINYQVLDKNTIEIEPIETKSNLTVSVVVADPNDVKGIKNIMQLAARGLMMVRNISFNYNQSNGVGLTGFKPSNGIFGQDSWGNKYAPGVLFSMGYQHPTFLQDAYKDNWLVRGDSTIEAASKTFTSDFSLRMAIEPIPSLKIDLGAARNYSTQSLVNYIYEGMPSTYSGTFSMTSIAVSTFFSSTGDASDNYYSTTYQRFKTYRAEAAAKLNEDYKTQRYPTNGFMSTNPALINQPYDEANGAFTQNSTDVLIPAFLAAYTGTDVKNQSFKLIPSILKLLPNWRISYDGLSQIPFIQEHFKNVNLIHAYVCKYNIGSFSSYASWIESENGYGFVQDVATEKPMPSSQFDVASVSITENFNPLLRIEATLKNSLTLSTEYRTGRNLALNIASTQMVESSNAEYVFGVGYRISDFDVILKLNNDKEQKIKNDLNLRLDISKKEFKTLIRKIDDDQATQATTGDNTFGLQFSAEYVFSSKMNFRLFYDLQTSNPLVSSYYPTSSQNFGISVKLLLTR